VTLPTDGSANQADLHPEFRRRLEALFADPRMGGHLVLVSGARPRSEQVYLYGRYLAGLGNLAANPDRRIGTFGGVTFRGSWHMVQGAVAPEPRGWAYAVDLNYSSLPWPVRQVLEQVAGEHGLQRTVPSESWHYQPIGYRSLPLQPWPLPNQPTPPDPEDLTVADISAITARLDKIDADLEQLRGGVLQSAVNVATSVAEDTDELRLLLNGAAALVQRGGSKWFVYAGQRINVTHLEVPQQRELKSHFGVERHSTQVSDPVWAILEAVTVERA